MATRRCVAMFAEPRKSMATQQRVTMPPGDRLVLRRYIPISPANRFKTSMPRSRVLRSAA
jgi:hypothetical protein